jgi:C1A family cysteine protease
MAKRTYAWRPDVPDHRDQLYSVPVEAVAALPPKVDRIGLGNRIEDQGQLGSCTGNSSTSAVEIITKYPGQLSRLMAYYEGRKIEGTVRQDAGAMIRDVIKGIQTYGVCNETLYPYVISKFTKAPTAAALKDAKKILPAIAGYQRLSTLADVKHALANGLPVVFGFSVPEFFESADVAKNGFVRMPTRSDKMIGGHAVVAVGYDDTAPTPFIWVRNSWGPDWGIQGYFKMDQKWFTDPSRLVDDMWVMTPSGKAMAEEPQVDPISTWKKILEIFTEWEKLVGLLKGLFVKS